MRYLIGMVQAVFFLLALVSWEDSTRYCADSGTLLLLAVGSQVAGTAYQVKAAKHQQKVSMALHKANAKALEEEIRRRRRADLEEQHIRREQALRLEKSIRAKVGKRGVQMEGSSLLATLQAVEDSAQDIAVISSERAQEIESLKDKMGISLFLRESAREAGRLAVGQAITGGIGQMGTTLAAVV